MRDQIFSITGALLVLGAYAGNLLHWLDRDGAPYATLNVVGSALLSYVALHSSPIGIILIEVAWTLISLMALIKALFSASEPECPQSPPSGVSK